MQITRARQEFKMKIVVSHFAIIYSCLHRKWCVSSRCLFSIVISPWAQLPADFSGHGGVMLCLRCSCWSWSRPLRTMLVVPLDAPQCISEASQRCLSALLRREHAVDLFLTEATSSCTEQIELDRESDTETATRIQSILKIKPPQQTPDHIKSLNRQ